VKISEFISKFHPIKGNLYRVYMPNDKNGIISMLAVDVSIPGVTFEKDGIFYNNFQENIVVGQDFDPITINFYATKEVLKYFKQWKEKIVDKNGFFGLKKNYAKNIEIELLDEKGNPIKKVKIIDAFPLNLPQIDLSAKNRDAFLEYAVTFEFKRFEEEIFESKKIKSGKKVKSIRETNVYGTKTTVIEYEDGTKDVITN